VSQGPLFLDTSYLVALTIETDSHHGKSTALQAQIAGARIPLVTSRAITVELGNYFARGVGRANAVRILTAMESDANVEVVPLTEAVYRRALQLYSERTDKAWGLTDGISFEIMRERGNTEALTAEEHFEQAGFRALPRGE
jgi:hypothetical protein